MNAPAKITRHARALHALPETMIASRWDDFSEGAATFSSPTSMRRECRVPVRAGLDSVATNAATPKQNLFA
jgi:hypothetical protein